MKTNAAVLWSRHAPWNIEEIDLDPPKVGEVLVQLKASGRCHTDEHLAEGDIAGLTPDPPIICAHEGAGIVVEVGPGVTGVEPGDHVVLSSMPACGRCHECSTGHSTLCELGAPARSRWVCRSAT